MVQRAAVMAGAGRLAAAFVHPREAGRQDGAGGHKLLESPVQHPTDQCRVAGNTHGWAPRTSGIWRLHRKRAKKPVVRRKKFSPGEADRLNGSSTLDLCCRQGATNFLFLRAGFAPIKREGTRSGRAGSTRGRTVLGPSRLPSVEERPRSLWRWRGSDGVQDRAGHGELILIEAAVVGDQAVGRRRGRSPSVTPQSNRDRKGRTRRGHMSRRHERLRLINELVVLRDDPAIKQSQAQ